MTTPELYELYLKASGVSTDTRQVKKGELFFALRGENFNANEFASEALKAGAIAAVIDDDRFSQEGTILVHDSLEALQDLARHHRKQLPYPIIGLTGSNGKTTSKELLVAALSEKYKTGYTKGNLNNHIGVPLTVLNLPADAEIAVIEMGANHQKEIEFLSEISRPNHGFITNFGKAHLEGFGGIEGIIKGKSELYENLRENNNTAWYNIEDPLQEEKSKGIKRFSFGASERANYPVFPVLKPNSPFLSVQFKQVTITSKLTGAYNFGNIACAVALASYFGLKPEEIKTGIEKYVPSNNRSQIAETGRNTLLRDYYNANPSSMQAALENFNGLAGSGKWVILGDMFELGEDSEKEHQAVADLCDAFNFEEVILVGSHFQKATAKARKVGTTKDAVALMQKLKPSGKFILIKGSRGMQLEKVAEHL